MKIGVNRKRFLDDGYIDNMVKIKIGVPSDYIFIDFDNIQVIIGHCGYDERLFFS